METEKYELELEVNISPKDETIWMTKEEISTLYNVDRSGISRHIKNIYDTGELEEINTCVKIEHMGSLNMQKYEVKLYNLDVIIAVGYRVNSNKGILFRKWANKVHDRYIIIDRSKLYHLGHSIKGLGKKIFSIIESDSRLIGELLKNVI